MRAVNASLAWAILLVSACSRSPKAAASRHAPNSDAAHVPASAVASAAATAPTVPVSADKTPSSGDDPVAAEQPADPCRPTSVQRGARAALVFVGQFVRTEEDPESGYAEALRRFYFKPLKSWHGLASASEISGAMFVPNPGEHSSLKAPPHFRRGQQVFVVVDRGGMSGQMNVVAEALPVNAAHARIEALGAPCWER